MTGNLREQLKQTALFAGFSDRQIDGVLAAARNAASPPGNRSSGKGTMQSVLPDCRGSAEVRSGARCSPGSGRRPLSARWPCCSRTPTAPPT